jgi:hypothetical protein
MGLLLELRPILKLMSLCLTQQEVQTTLGEVVRDNSSAGTLDESVAAYVSGLATHLINARDFASDTWTNKVVSCSCISALQAYCLLLPNFSVQSCPAHNWSVSIHNRQPGHVEAAFAGPVPCILIDVLLKHACNSAQVVKPYLAGLVPEADLDKVSEVFLQRCLKEIASKEKEDLEENEGEDLCNCEFSLAYGVSPLLHCLVQAPVRSPDSCAAGCQPNGR